MLKARKKEKRQGKKEYSRGPIEKRDERKEEAKQRGSDSYQLKKKEDSEQITEKKRSFIERQRTQNKNGSYMGACTGHSADTHATAGGDEDATEARVWGVCAVSRSFAKSLFGESGPTGTQRRA